MVADWRYLDQYRAGGVGADGVLWDIDRRYRAEYVQAAAAEKVRAAAEAGRDARLVPQDRARQQWIDSIVPAAWWSPDETALTLAVTLAVVSFCLRTAASD